MNIRKTVFYVRNTFRKLYRLTFRKLIFGLSIHSENSFLCMQSIQKHFFHICKSFRKISSESGILSETFLLCRHAFRNLLFESPVYSENLFFFIAATIQKPYFFYIINTFIHQTHFFFCIFSKFPFISSSQSEILCNPFRKYPFTSAS